MKRLSSPYIVEVYHFDGAKHEYIMEYMDFTMIDYIEKQIPSIEERRKMVYQVKHFTLPDGNIINYGEVKNDKPALLLTHGQMSVWEDYAPVMPELCKNWHIYAVNVYGHGGSSHDESL